MRALAGVVDDDMLQVTFSKIDTFIVYCIS